MLKKSVLILLAVLLAFTVISCEKDSNNLYDGDENTIRTFKVTQSDSSDYFIEKRNGLGQALEFTGYDKDGNETMRMEFDYSDSVHSPSEIKIYMPDGALLQRTVREFDGSQITDATHYDSNNGIVFEEKCVSIDKIDQMKQKGEQFSALEYDKHGRIVRWYNWYPDGYVADTISEYDKYGLKTETTYDGEGNVMYKLEYTLVE